MFSIQRPFFGLASSRWIVEYIRCQWLDVCDLPVADFDFEDDSVDSVSCYI